MKKIKLSLLTLTLLLVATVATATPQYHGPTSAPSDFGIGPDSAAGFYIWNNAESPRDWSIRWYAGDADHAPVSWLGKISFFNSTLEHAEEFSFTGEDDFSVTMDEPGELPFIKFKSLTNNTGGVDGLNFTLAGGYELLKFTLGSSIFDDSDAVLDDSGVKSDFIFIGGELNQPNVLINEIGGTTYHNFEVKVPEPGTLALLGLGLFGLALTRRRAS